MLPLLNEEGALCGSSYLNEAFREHVRTRLEDEHYLESNGLTMQGIIDKEVVLFENGMKRRIDITKLKVKDLVWIQGIKANSAKNLSRNQINMKTSAITKISRSNRFC